MTRRLRKDQGIELLPGRAALDPALAAYGKVVGQTFEFLVGVGPGRV